MQCQNWDLQKKHGVDLKKDGKIPDNFMRVLKFDYPDYDFLKY
jgi:hypothetical protein